MYVFYKEITKKVLFICKIKMSGLPIIVPLKCVIYDMFTGFWCECIYVVPSSSVFNTSMHFIAIKNNEIDSIYLSNVPNTIEVTPATYII